MNTDCLLLPVPTGLRATWDEKYKGAVKLTWDNNAETYGGADFYSYRVYRRAMTEHSPVVWIAETWECHFIDTLANVQAGISHSYSVSALHRNDWFETSRCPEVLVEPK